jgi:hypothetical protein
MKIILVSHVTPQEGYHGQLFACDKTRGHSFLGVLPSSVDLSSYLLESAVTSHLHWTEWDIQRMYPNVGDI